MMKCDSIPEKSFNREDIFSVHIDISLQQTRNSFETRIAIRKSYVLPHTIFYYAFDWIMDMSALMRFANQSGHSTNLEYADDAVL